MNVLGSLIAAAFVESDWSLSFIYPGLIISLVGFILVLFLVVHPSDVGCTSPKTERDRKVSFIVLFELSACPVCKLITFSRDIED